MAIIRIRSISSGNREEREFRSFVNELAEAINENTNKITKLTKRLDGIQEAIKTVADNTLALDAAVKAIHERINKIETAIKKTD